MERRTPFDCQIAFFGGSFTMLPRDMMVGLLDAAAPYLASGKAQSIRISTRPDAIDEEILSLLWEKGVRSIELGAQSTDDSVLRAAGRGYTASAIRVSSEKILQKGFSLGLQMMIGLPQDTPETSMRSAQDFAAWGASETRIYPTLVLKDTPLSLLYKSGRYTPLTLDEALHQCVTLTQFFEEKHITLLKVGLHASLAKEDIVAGPWHPAFGEMVRSRIFRAQMEAQILQKHLQKGDTLDFAVQDRDVSAAVGQKKENISYIMEKYGVKIFLKILKND